MNELVNTKTTKRTKGGGPKTKAGKSTSTLTISDLTTRYRCRCGNTAETGIRLEAIVCVRCGAAMKATS